MFTGKIRKYFIDLAMIGSAQTLSNRPANSASASAPPLSAGSWNPSSGASVDRATRDRRARRSAFGSPGALR